jgi:uncharacterized protein YbjT (DUF2867 family)
VPQTILLVGATGMLGNRIAHYLVEEPNVRLRLLVRDSRNFKKRQQLDPVLRSGAEFVEGDLEDITSLDRATQGVDVIVSAVQGDRGVIVDGQVALAEAAKRNGVRRIIPSDFGLDLFKSTPGEHSAFDARRDADEAIKVTGLEHIHILQGGFLDLLGPGSPLVDYDRGVVSFWGTGDEIFEVTSVDDTARMTSKVALDRSVASGKFAFAGDRISFNRATDIIEHLTGKTFERRSHGNEDSLRAAMAAAEPRMRVMLAYQLYMMNGQTALTDLQNDRYPDVNLQSFDVFIKSRLSAAERV